MSETVSPLTLFLSRLMSLGHSGDTLTELVALAEAAFARPARSSATPEDQREVWRLRKAAQRAGKRGHVPGTMPDPSLSKTLEVVGKRKKKNLDVPMSRGQSGTPTVRPDDWPDDHLEIFWKAFPPYRRQAKVKVAAKLARIRAEKVSWEILFGGVVKFAATNPGKYAPAPMVWLNEGRWDREYGTQQGGGNGEAQGTGGAKVGFAGLAARLRQSDHDGNLPFDEPPARPD